MIITTCQKHQRIPRYNVSITINKVQIERVSHIKFLGVIVDKIYLGHNILKRLIQKWQNPHIS